MITITTTKTGRHVIKKDGYDEGFRAYEIGSLTGKVSLPATMDVWRDEGGMDIVSGMTLGAAFGAAVRGEIPGARCYDIGKIA